MSAEYRNLTDEIPSACPITAYDMTNEVMEYIREEKRIGCTIPADSDIQPEAVDRLIGWHKSSTGKLETIRSIGLIRFIQNQTAPFIWATLLGLKDQGITDLPL